VSRIVNIHHQAHPDFHFHYFCRSIFSFSLIQIMPGDPARLALGYEASEEDVQALREEMNLDN